MNSLAHADERERAFVGAIEPLSDSVFHNKGELLWMVKYYLDNNKQDANAPDELYDYLRSQLEIRRTGYEEKSITYSGFLYPSSDTPVGDRGIVFRSVWFDFAQVILIAAERLWRDVFLADATDKVVKSRFHAARRRRETSRNAPTRRLAVLKPLCQQSHTLMHLWLQATLFLCSRHAERA